MTTSLSGGGQSGTSISVPTGTAVTDTAALSGTNASSATGSVTYNVYTDSGCSDLASAGTPETITTAGQASCLRSRDIEFRGHVLLAGRLLG